MIKQRKTPLRMCTGCGEMKDRSTLVRVVKSPEGLVSLDLIGKKPGRGAYICKDSECLKKARKNRRIERSFKMKIEIEIYEAMERELGDLNG